jgi:hypothetical protein
MPRLPRAVAVPATANLVVALAAAWAVTLVEPRDAAAALRLNEVLYDPDGEDAGAEFVEIWNDGDHAESLLGVSVEAGDGSRPGSWVSIFAGVAGDSAAAHAPFLIPASRLLGAIQNGPDAVRLMRDGVQLDAVGWGDFSSVSSTSTEFFEGAPAPDAASGESLARRGDGADSDRNDLDWGAERPTPGAPNHPPYRVSVSNPRLRPEVVGAGGETSVGLTARNDGTRPLSAGDWGIVIRVRVRPVALPALPWVEAGRFTGPGIAPGDSTRLSSGLRPAESGAFVCRMVSWIAVAGEGGARVEALQDSCSVLGRSGVGPVAIDEFAYRDDGAGEWVELLALEPVASWEAFALGDASGAPRRLLPRGGPPGAVAGERRVVAADPARLTARFGVPDSLLLVAEGGWLSLNDGASSSPSIAPYADLVRLLDGDVPSDAVAYEANWSERGGSIERLSPLLASDSRRSWAESVSPSGGTPGAPNSVAASSLGSPPAPLLAASRRVLRRDGPGGAGAIVLELGPGVAERDVRLTILDLRGRARRVLATGERFGGPAALLWDGRDDAGRPVEPGLYVARLEAGRTGGFAHRASLALAVAPGRKGAP